MGILRKIMDAVNGKKTLIGSSLLAGATIIEKGVQLGPQYGTIPPTPALHAYAPWLALFGLILTGVGWWHKFIKNAATDTPAAPTKP